MIGILAKSLRECWLGTVLIGIGFGLVAVLINLVIPDLQGQLLEMWGQVPFIRLMIGALMGVQIDEGTTARVFLTIIWTHPIVLALIWTHEITYCTRFPAGETDRGTIDVLLSLPVSRGRIYLAETIGWLLSGCVVIGIGCAGYWIGTRFVEPGSRLGLGEVGLIVLNLGCLYVGVGGAAMMVSAMSERRGRAIGTVVGVLLASFLWTFLGPFWEPARVTGFLSVLEYYRPAEIVMRGGLGWRDPVVLGGIGLVGWCVGLVVVRGRDVATT